jgi:hypothetical protein
VREKIALASSGTESGNTDVRLTLSSRVGFDFIFGKGGIT